MWWIWILLGLGMGCLLALSYADIMKGRTSEGGSGLCNDPLPSRPIMPTRLPSPSPTKEAQYDKGN